MVVHAMLRDSSPVWPNHWPEYLVRTTTIARMPETRHRIQITYCLRSKAERETKDRQSMMVLFYILNLTTIIQRYRYYEKDDLILFLWHEWFNDTIPNILHLISWMMVMIMTFFFCGRQVPAWLPAPYLPFFFLKIYIDETIQDASWTSRSDSSRLHGGCYERVALFIWSFTCNFCSLSDTNLFSSSPGDSFYNIFLSMFIFILLAGWLLSFISLPCYSLRKSVQAGLWMDGYWVSRGVV